MDTHYTVTGMTCEHCVAHVTEEVEALEGVEKAAVTLAGSMVVTSEVPIEFSAIREAVAEAGDYSVQLA